MIAEEQFEGGLACLVHLVGFAFDDHSWFSASTTGRYEFAVDFHEANETGGQWPTLFQIAKGGDIDLQLASAIENALAREQVDCVTVNGDSKAHLTSMASCGHA